MHPDRSNWRIRPPAITLSDIGPRGWTRLHELAIRRGRSDADQVLALVRYALTRSLDGEGVELTDDQLDQLLADSTEDTKLQAALA